MPLPAWAQVAILAVLMAGLILSYIWAPGASQLLMGLFATAAAAVFVNVRASRAPAPEEEKTLGFKKDEE